MDARERGLAKLIPEERSARRLCREGRSVLSLARQLNLIEGGMGDIVTGKNWKHLPVNGTRKTNSDEGILVLMDKQMNTITLDPPWWRCENGNEFRSGRSKPKRCPVCGSANIEMVTDVDSAFLPHKRKETANDL
jgi:hypothetical protein